MNAALTELLPTLQLLPSAIGETLIMVLVAIVFAICFGIPLGVILVTTEKNHILANPKVNKILASIINTIRSIPFIILLVALIPLAHLITGISIGTKAFLVPLSLAATPFMARIIESALKEVDWGIIEAAKAMGASPRQIIFKVMIPEALSSIILGITIISISLIEYSAMAGMIGGGGLGNLAITYGYYRYQTDVMLETIVVLIIIVQTIQFTGNYFAKKVNKK